MINIVKAIERHKNNKSERMNEIISILELNSIAYEVQVYKTGKNLIVTLGNEPFIGIGSHYDAVPESPGANDNASAIAVSLNILRKVKISPLEKIGIRAFFFDEEENGLVGSKEYIKEKGIENLIGIYNMELVGSGNNIVLWQVDDQQNTLLLKTFEYEARKQKTETHRIPAIVTNSADHQSFKEAGLEDSFTITAVTKEDLSIAPKYYRALQNGDIAECWNILSKAPVFRHYHKPTDESKHLSIETLEMVSSLLFESIRSIDKRY